MNFEQALQAALSGRLIAREAWPASQVLRHCGDWYVGYRRCTYANRIFALAQGRDWSRQ